MKSDKVREEIADMIAEGKISKSSLELADQNILAQHTQFKLPERATCNKCGLNLCSRSERKTDKSWVEETITNSLCDTCKFPCPKETRSPCKMYEPICGCGKPEKIDEGVR